MKPLLHLTLSLAAISVAAYFAASARDVYLATEREEANRIKR